MRVKKTRAARVKNAPGHNLAEMNCWRVLSYEDLSLRTSNKKPYANKHFKRLDNVLNMVTVANLIAETPETKAHL